MKMAKAREADIKMAMDLCSALEALTGRWGATMPEAIEQPEGASDTEYFDPEDSEQCKRVVAYLLKLTGSASLMRVVWGMAVVCDPANKLLDPNADTLEQHPENIAARDALELAIQAMRAPLDDWKGELERKALDAARAAFGAA